MIPYIPNKSFLEKERSLTQIKNLMIKSINRFDGSLDPKEYHKYRLTKWKEATMVWQKIRRDVFDDDICTRYDSLLVLNKKYYYLENMPRLFSFGYHLGFEISKMMGGEEHKNSTVGVYSGIFNVSVSLFDKICDNYSCLFDRLIHLISRKSLDSAIRIIVNGGNAKLCITSRNDHILIRILCFLICKYLEIWYQAKKYKKNEIVLEFQGLIRTLYNNQMKSLSCRLDSTLNFKNLYDILFKKSALILWGICLTSVAVLNKTKEMTELKPIMYELGKAIWIIDDITDSFEDLNNNHWNYILMKLYFKHGIALCEPNRLIKSYHEFNKKLMTTGTINESVDELCNILSKSFSSLRYKYPNTEAFERFIITSIIDWIGIV